MLMLKECAALSAFHTKSQSILSFFGGYCLWQYATGSAYVLVSLRAYGYAFFFGGYCLWQYATGSVYVLVSLRAYGYAFYHSPTVPPIAIKKHRLNPNTYSQCRSDLQQYLLFLR